MKYPWDHHHGSGYLKSFISNRSQKKDDPAMLWAYDSVVVMKIFGDGPFGLTNLYFENWAPWHSICSLWLFNVFCFNICKFKPAISQ